MERDLVSLGLKWLGTWVVLLLAGLLYRAPAGALAAVALVVAVALWLADRGLPVQLQGATRWAIEGGIAGAVIYAVSLVAPIRPWPFLACLVAGYAVGAAEIPLHHFLAERYGRRLRDDRRDGIH